jgi:hypothetical protein
LIIDAWTTMEPGATCHGSLSLAALAAERADTDKKSLPEDPQHDFEHTGSRDQATRPTIYLDASQHRPDISLSPDVPGFIQEDLAVPVVGR